MKYFNGIKNKIVIGILLFFGFASLYVVQGQAMTGNFYAYHTKMSHTSTDYLGKYADLIVVLGTGKQLEFTRQTNYVPRWVTPVGTYLLQEFYPERDTDHSFYYNYVRLIEDSPDKIVVHWRYVPEIEMMKQINQQMDPTAIQGFTNVVHEIFTIYPSGKIERIVKDARNSQYDAWMRPGFAHYQTLQLADHGIDYNPVTWGYQTHQIPESAAKSPVKSRNNIPVPSILFSFNEGGGDFANTSAETTFRRAVNTAARRHEVTSSLAIDCIHVKTTPISGHGALYKKGVSGTALAFDGYYTGINYDAPLSDILSNGFTLEAWVALDAYPWNNAPVAHHSRQFGEQGFFLGIDPYGKAFITVNGSTAKAQNVTPLYTWTHIAATINDNTAILFINAAKVAETKFTGDVSVEDTPFSIGINTEKERCTDFVRGYNQNIPFIYGLQGLLDEVAVYNKVLSEKALSDSYLHFLPADTKSDLQKAVLPGEVGVSETFGAKYKTLPHHELWDRMWRLTDYTDIVVKFDNHPGSVVYWHGTNFAPNWVTDNNRWMADQSSEIFSFHGCSEHMGDKQNRHSFARIIENNDARVVIHWRHPCVDVGYIINHKRNWADEYHTIYPDGTAIRKVTFNHTRSPSFQDIQFLTNPGETAMDVVHLNAMTVANTKGEIHELTWQKPNIIPELPIEDATIQWLNSRSEYKVFTVFPAPGFNPWGDQEQSAYTDDPFAGPWNHWPVSLLPSDGRFAVAHDRVTHFALAAHDDLPRFGSVMLYGFTNKTVETVIPIARAWQNPPSISTVRGAENLGFNKDDKAFEFRLDGVHEIGLTINATRESPLVNPCLVLYQSTSKINRVAINDKILTPGRDVRLGEAYDAKGQLKTIIWLNYTSEKETKITVAF